MLFLKKDFMSKSISREILNIRKTLFWWIFEPKKLKNKYETNFNSLYVCSEKNITLWIFVSIWGGLGRIYWFQFKLRIYRFWWVPRGTVLDIIESVFRTIFWFFKFKSLKLLYFNLGWKGLKFELFQAFPPRAFFLQIMLLINFSKQK